MQTSILKQAILSLIDNQIKDYEIKILKVAMDIKGSRSSSKREEANKKYQVLSR